MKKDGRMHRIIKKWLESKDNKDTCPFFTHTYKIKYCCSICGHFFPRTRRKLDKSNIIGKGKMYSNWMEVQVYILYNLCHKKYLKAIPCPCILYSPKYVYKKVREILENAHVG